MPGATCFKTKSISIKFIAFTNPIWCISKGKAHKPFVPQQSLNHQNRDSGIILGALALPRNPRYNTVKDALKQIKGSLEISRKSSSLTGVTKVKRNLAKPVC